MSSLDILDDSVETLVGLGTLDLGHHVPGVVQASGAGGVGGHSGEFSRSEADVSLLCAAGFTINQSQISIFNQSKMYLPVKIKIINKIVTGRTLDTGLFLIISAVFIIVTCNNQSEISIIVFNCVEQSEISIELCQPIRCYQSPGLGTDSLNSSVSPPQPILCL